MTTPASSKSPLPMMQSLARQRIERGERISFRAEGFSMMPRIRPGDVLQVAKGEHEPGSDVLFWSASRNALVCHRCVTRSPGETSVAGHGQATSERVPDEHILGVVVGVDRDWKSPVCLLAAGAFHLCTRVAGPGRRWRR